MADAGAGVAVLLLAEARLPAPATAVAGALVAVYTVPHVFGPLLARRLDLARDVRPFLATAFAAYAVLLGAAGLLLDAGAVPVVFVAVGLAGLAGPLLTGGLSSRLTELVPPDERTQRRAQGLDAATYGLAGTLGPALVAAVAAFWSPLASVLTLGVLALLAGGLVLVIPIPKHRAGADGAVPSVRQVLAVVVTNGPLRRVNALTMATAAAQAGLAIVAVQLAPVYDVRPTSTAALLAAMGAGNLAGALLLTVVPLRGEPDRLVLQSTTLIGACFLACAAAPLLGWAFVAFTLMGLLTAFFVTATFAGRNTYAPAEARAQVFVTLAALKITAASAGTAAAGLLVAFGARPLLVGMSAVVLATSGAALIDRLRTGTATSGSAPTSPGATRGRTGS
jgi:MFS family permease